MDDATNNSKSDAKAGRLSDLQRSILRLAYRNRVAEGRTGDEWKVADVYYVEVLVDHFKFPAPRADLRSPEGKSFKRDGSTGRAIASANAALSRAVRRLAARGLCLAMCGRRTRWSGVNLTDAGVRVASETHGTRSDMITAGTGSRATTARGAA